MVLGEAVCLHSMVKGNRCWNRDPHGNERWGPSCPQSTTCAIHREFLPSPVKNLKMCLSSVPLSITHQVQDKAIDKLTADLYLRSGGNVIHTPSSGQQTSAHSASLFFSVAG